MEVVYDKTPFIKLTDQVRLYYKPEEDFSGYSFTCLKACEWDKYMFDNSTKCDIIVKGEAFWDGIRHIWWGVDYTGWIEDHVSRKYIPNKIAALMLGEELYNKLVRVTNDSIRRG